MDYFKYKLKENQYIPRDYGTTAAATYYYFVDEKNRVINYKTLKPYKGKQMNIYAVKSKIEAGRILLEINKPFLPKMIAKKDLVGGKYYKGYCRNANIALWDEKNDHFVYIRNKFGYYMDTLKHFEDVAESRQDGFIPLEAVEELPWQVIQNARVEVGY